MPCMHARLGAPRRQLIVITMLRGCMPCTHTRRNMSTYHRYMLTHQLRTRRHTAAIYRYMYRCMCSCCVYSGIRGVTSLSYWISTYE